MQLKETIRRLEDRHVQHNCSCQSISKGLIYLYSTILSSPAISQNYLDLSFKENLVKRVS
jgi:hypothetical protein